MPHCEPDPDLSRPFDVVIAGAGLAGGSLALRLARAGARVALVDAARFPRDKLCGEFLSPESWGVLDRLGLAGAIRRGGYHAVRRVRITTPRGTVVEAEFQDSDGLPGIGLSRSTLDDLLVRDARAAGATVIEGARVGGPLLRDGRVAGVVARRRTGNPLAIDARVTVAADGRTSGLVPRTGSTRPRSRLRPRLFGLKRHLQVPPEVSEPEGTVGLHLVDGGYGGTCRIEGTCTNLCALLPESALRRHRGDLDRLAEDQFRRNPILARLWDASAPAGEWKTVAGVRVEDSFPRVPGIFYAGDCQGTIDPLGGQGMTMALLGAELLAPRVLEAVAAGGVDPRAQRAYADAWHHRFDRRIALCRLFHHALVNPRWVDLVGVFQTLAPRLLSACFAQTRDSRRAGIAPGA
jgi:flavin-dependent dehydrogenase